MPTVKPMLRKRNTKTESPAKTVKSEKVAKPEIKLPYAPGDTVYVDFGESDEHDGHDWYAGVVVKCTEKSVKIEYNDGDVATVMARRWDKVVRGAPTKKETPFLGPVFDAATKPVPKVIKGIATPKQGPRIVFRTLKAIQQHQFVGSFAADQRAFDAIDKFAADETRPLAERAEALRIMSDRGMGCGRDEKTNDRTLVRQFMQDYAEFSTTGRKQAAKKAEQVKAAPAKTVLANPAKKKLVQSVWQCKKCSKQYKYNPEIMAVPTCQNPACVKRK